MTYNFDLELACPPPPRLWRDERARWSLNHAEASAKADDRMLARLDGTYQLPQESTEE